MENIYQPVSESKMSVIQWTKHKTKNEELPTSHSKNTEKYQTISFTFGI